MTDTPTLTLYDQSIPTLPAGHYELRLDQTLTPAQSPAIPEATKQIYVQGLRFSLPARDIDRVFPPAGATGAFDTYLPMIVFSRRSIPWERELESPRDADTLPWELRDTPTLPKPAFPWMALIVLTPDDLASDATTSQRDVTTGAVNMTVTALTTAVAGTWVPTLATEGAPVEDPNAITCATITITAAAFAALAPSLREARLLAHARQVSGAADKPGWYSTVVANRFAVSPSATPSQTNIVHLVSLEGLEQLLSGATTLSSDIERVRMVSLHSWSFRCTHDPIETFSQRMRDIVGAARSPRALLEVTWTDGAGYLCPSSGSNQLTVAGSPADADKSNYEFIRVAADGASLASGMLLIHASSGRVVQGQGHANPVTLITAAAALKSLDACVFYERPTPGSPDRVCYESRAFPGEYVNVSGGTGPGRTIQLWTQTPDGNELSVIEIPSETVALVMSGPGVVGFVRASSSGVLLAAPPALADRPACTFSRVPAVAGDPSQGEILVNQRTGLVIRAQGHALAVELVSWLDALASLDACVFFERAGTQASAVQFESKAYPGEFLNVSGGVGLGRLIQLWGSTSDGNDITVTKLVDEGKLLRLPPAPVDNVARERIEAGYVALRSVVRTGNATFAWYRGPFAPTTTPVELAITAPGTSENLDVPQSADEAMIFSCATGVFDLSYATAFELGRLLALANRPFALGLMSWRRRSHALVDLLLERIQASSSTPILDAQAQLTAAGTELAGLLDQSLLPNALASFFSSTLFAEIAASIGQAGSYTPTDAAAPSLPIASTTTSTSTSVDQLRTLMQSPDVVDLIHQLTGLDDHLSDKTMDIARIVDWLAELALLHGVPLANLVPDARMLPPESIRFFVIDRDWIASLLDGALSIGLASSRDTLLHQLSRDRIHRAVDGALAGVRARVAGLDPGALGAEDLTAGQLTGLLLRSVAVRDWPGLEVKGSWQGPAGTTAMRPLRFDRLGPDLLLVLFPELPTQVKLTEPREGLVCGLEGEVLHVRAIAGSNVGQMTGTTAVPVFRTSAGYPGVMDVLATFASVLPSPDEQTGSAAFALALLRVPESVTFSFAVGGAA
jgi:hypothetical protein